MARVGLGQGEQLGQLALETAQNVQRAVPAAVIHNDKAALRTDALDHSMPFPGDSLNVGLLIIGGDYNIQGIQRKRLLKQDQVLCRGLPKAKVRLSRNCTAATTKMEKIFTAMR